MPISNNNGFKKYVKRNTTTREKQMVYKENRAGLLSE
jgi:hypothetical protein